jgi:Epoxide hydrolase N terminus
LLAYWADGFDWRAAERWLNGFGHFRAEIDGVRVHLCANGPGGRESAWTVRVLMSLGTSDVVAVRPDDHVKQTGRVISLVPSSGPPGSIRMRQ